MVRVPAGLTLLFGAALLAASAIAAAVEIREWTVPYPDTRPRDPSVAPDGRVWFVGQTGNYLAVFDPANEAFARYDLPEGTKPHTVVVDREGRPWVAGNGNGTILRYGADGRLQQTYAVPEEPGIATRDPHTFAFDGRGGMWFTMQQGNAIGHLDTKTGAIGTVVVPTKDSRPYGIVATPDGDAWAVLFAAGKLVRVARADLALEEIALPRAASRPRRLGLDDDGNVWYVDNAHGHLGRYDPKAKTAEEWLSPSTPAAPYAMAVVDGVPWWFESGPQPNLLRSFDYASATFSDGVAIPGGGGTVRHMEYDPERRSLWFGTDRNTLGQAELATK